MADYTITNSDVHSGGFESPAASAEVEALIAMADRADACLEGAGVADAIGKQLKIYAVRHVLTLTANGGRGQVTSEGSASGASRSFKAFEGSRLTGTPYGAALAAMDASGCVTALFAARSGMAFMSVGPSR